MTPDVDAARPRVVVAPDKFRGTARADEVARAAQAAAERLGYDCDVVPLADGGDGLIDVLGGANRTSCVTGPLGSQVRARWQLRDGRAVIEMAEASGLRVVGGPTNNDPIAASTIGTGELIVAALEAGAQRIIVGIGGSATTDGGLGALRAISRMEAPRRLVDLDVACDVRTVFRDAADLFAPQKGATPEQVAVLRHRLHLLAQHFTELFARDVFDLPYTGAGGGLAGGLAVAGGKLIGGFDLVAREVGLDGVLAGACLVITGEGFVDEQSFDGKVVGGVVERARAAGVPALVVAGDVDADVERRVDAVSLVQTFGAARAHDDPLRCIEAVVTRRLGQRQTG